MRLSTTTETRISACSRVGSSSQLRAARCQEASERTSSGFGRGRAALVGAQAAGAQPGLDAAADRERVLDEPLALGVALQAIALSTSDPGVASRRATLPSASQANGTSSGPTSAIGEVDEPPGERVDDHGVHGGDAQRVGRARGAARTIVGRSSRIACARASTEGARAIAARR